MTTTTISTLSIHSIFWGVHIVSLSQSHLKSFMHSPCRLTMSISTAFRTSWRVQKLSAHRLPHRPSLEVLEGASGRWSVGKDQRWQVESEWRWGWWILMWMMKMISIDKHHEHTLKNRRRTLTKASEAREHCVLVKGKSLMLWDRACQIVFGVLGSANISLWTVKIQAAICQLAVCHSASRISIPNMLLCAHKGAEYYTWRDKANSARLISEFIFLMHRPSGLHGGPDHYGCGAKICFGKAKKSFYNSLESCIPRFVNNFFMGLSAILIGLGLGYESKAWRKFQVFQHFSTWNQLR